MTPVNGHANGPVAAELSTPPATTTPTGPQSTSEEIRQLIAQLEVPFHSSVIEWRVTNTSKNGKPRGQVIPYADQRAYTDRLNVLFTPAGWTRKYTVQASASFERSKDKKIAAKILVTCEVTINRVGAHSATGEEWADDENAATSAEAQAFKRACACFGLGRYLYYFSGVWVDLDDRKRPRKLPSLPKWATPEGWQQGLRPQTQTVIPPAPHPPSDTPGTHQSRQAGNGNREALIRQIAALEEPLRKRLYRGLLKTVARAWHPSQIQDAEVLERVLAHMQSAQRGLLRLDAALNTLGPGFLQPLLRGLNLRSLDSVDNLEMLKQIVLAAEEAAAKTGR